MRYRTLHRLPGLIVLASILFGVAAMAHLASDEHRKKISVLMIKKNP